MTSRERIFYRFAYHNPPKHKFEDLLLHQLRDGDAALEIASHLVAKGYSYGGLLLNYPYALLRDRESSWPRTFDDSFLKSGDLLLITGRPPLSDELSGSSAGEAMPGQRAKSRIDRSNTTLEEKVFRFLRGYFDHCSRAEVRLNRDTVPLPAHLEAKRRLVFRQNLGATYISYGRGRDCGDVRRTALFLIHSAEAWPGGPGILCAFGMGGPETLMWAHLLRTEYPDLLDAEGFVFAETEDFAVPTPASTLAFVRGHAIDIVATASGPVRFGG